MLLHLLLLFLLLFILFLLPRKISSFIYKSVYILTKNKNFSLGILLIFQLPGTIIHELSHFIMASILRVPTRELTIIPKVEENGEVKAGRLIYDSVDPVRQILIGLAPMIIGLIIIYLIGKFLLPNQLSLRQLADYQLSIFLGFYLLFITSFTMFSSKKDIESLIIVGPLMIMIILSLYITGVRVYFEKSLIDKITLILTDLNFYLLLAVIINSLVFLGLSTNLYFWQKILKRKTN